MLLGGTFHCGTGLRVPIGIGQCEDLGGRLVDERQPRETKLRALESARSQLASKRMDLPGQLAGTLVTT